MIMHQTTFETHRLRQSTSYIILMLALGSALLLVACDNAAVQLCGEYACVAYKGDCAGLGNCNDAEIRQCESAGSIRDRVPRIINQLREAQRSCSGGTNTNNAATLAWNEALATVSAAHARDMADNQFLSFVGSNGLSTTQRATQAGISSSIVVESISGGQQTAAEAINYWLDISTDCQQLIGTQTTRIGMACAVSDQSKAGPYWSILLTGPQIQE